jgi:hypothetical protein
MRGGLAAVNFQTVPLPEYLPWGRPLGMGLMWRTIHAETTAFVAGHLAALVYLGASGVSSRASRAGSMDAALTEMGLRCHASHCRPCDRFHYHRAWDELSRQLALEFKL